MLLHLESVSYADRTGVSVHAVYVSMTPGCPRSLHVGWAWDTPVRAVTSAPPPITHAATYSYDNHVPVIFLGPGIRAGEYDGPIAVNDIAATLASILHVETPSGSVGRALTEMLTR
jgi:hypothetical protein